MCKLSETCQIFMGKAAVSEQFGNICVLWFVLGCQLCSMKIEPPLDLLLLRKLMEVWWRWCPGWIWAPQCWNVGKFCLGHVGNLTVGC